MTRISPNRLATRNADLQKDQPAGPRLRELEAIIKRGQKAFVEVGYALLEIRESRLYRDRGYTSFDEYCREHWQIAKPQAHRLIVAAQTVEEVVPIGTTPATESQARELARADAPAEVWAEVVDQHEPQEITAAVIREHVEARKTPSVLAPPPTVVVDLTAVTKAVRAAVRAGATTQELYAAYQAGFH